MPYEDHSDFLEILRRAMLFAVDERSSGCDALPTNEFFAKIHVPRETEDEAAVARAVREADRLAVVVAPLGGGKTTILHNALRAASGKKALGFFVFDFKEQVEKFYALKGRRDDVMHFLRDIIVREVVRHLLASFDTKVEYVFTALTTYLRAERLHSLVLRYLKKGANPMIAGNDAALKKLFLEDYEAIEEEERFVMKALSGAEVITTIKRAKGWRKFALVLDNVDRLTVPDQPYLFSLAIDLFRGGDGEFGVIVAVRNKNLMRYEAAGIEGDVVDVVSLNTDITVRTKPVRVLPPDASYASQLLRKRHQYALEAKLTKGSADSCAASRRLFRQMAGHVDREFVDERFYNLANHSIRHMCLLNLEFYRYLFRLAASGTIADEGGAVRLSQASTLSYLYRWVYAIHNPDHRFILDVVSRYGQYRSGAITCPLDCDLELVMLAWLACNQRRFLRVGDILNSFEEIGVGPDKTLNSLFRLYDVKVSNRYVEIGDTEQHVAFGELKSTPTTRVGLQPLGLEFVGRTITKFEFLYQSQAHPSIREPDSREMLTAVSEEIEEKTEVVLDFLREMKEVHVASLLGIKAACSARHPNWEEFYRGSFCVGNMLVLERTVISHLQHLAATYPRVHLLKKADYANLLRDYYRKFGSQRTVEKVLAGLI